MSSNNNNNLAFDCYEITNFMILQILYVYKS